MEKKVTVMYVDDSAADRTLFKIILSHINASIKYLPALNAQEALAYLNSDSNQMPDVIFLDINMPGMDGIECLKRIKEIPHAKDIPVMMYSNYIHSVKEAALLIGAQDCLQKESDLDKAVTQIQSVLTLPVSST